MHNYNPRKILVTGGAGFIGSNYIRFLLKHDPSIFIVNLDNLTYAGSLRNLENLPNEEKHHFVQGDIRDHLLIANLLKGFNIDTIVHFAAESHVDRSIAEPDAFIQTNILGTFTLLEATRQYWLGEVKDAQDRYRFHHISTDEVFGTLTKEAPAFTEVSPYAPNSPYSASKASSDHLVRAYYATYHLPITITNCSNNFGPYQHAEKFIPTVIRACLKGEPIPIYGNGSQIRDWLYVEDHCRDIHTVICQGRIGESYNIGGENELDNLTLTRKICELMDKCAPKPFPHHSLITFVTDRLGHDFRYAIDVHKLKNAGLWQPSSNFDSAIQKTIAFYCHD